MTLGAAAAAAGVPAAVPHTAGWQIRMEQHIIIRVPIAPDTRLEPRDPPLPPMRWRERHGGKCMMVDAILGARTDPPGALQFVMHDGTVMRAYLEKGCEARSFYSGFYMERPADGKLCVRRDILHARSGARCMFDRLRRLQVRR